MTNGELKLFERWKDQVASQLTSLSGQMDDLRRDMVTRQEFGPIAEKVEQHDTVYRWGKKSWNRLAWIGLISIWLSPHIVQIVKDATSWLQGLVR